MNRNGELTEKHKQQFGGEFSLSEKIFKKGIGSNKLVYHSGIPEFDSQFRNNPGEIPFVNFELLKNGLIARLNVNQRFACVGALINNIKSIDLIAFRIEVHFLEHSISKIKLVHRGELEIKLHNNKISNFVIYSKDMKPIISFFNKSEFQAIFNYSISINPLEKDYAYLTAILGTLT